MADRLKRLREMADGLEGSAGSVSLSVPDFLWLIRQAGVQEHRPSQGRSGRGGNQSERKA